MMKKLNTIFTILLFHLISTSAFAQHVTCNNTRYITDEFINADTTTAILFGNNTTFGGNNQDLYMDIYEPAGDVATTRPVIIIAFGGQFIAGTRQDVSELCNYYAKRGFVAASIDYRLFDGQLFPLPSSSDITDVLIKASSDMKAAVRFLKEDAATSNTYKIDSNFIFIGGIGSGAIVANHVAYLDSTDSVSPSVSNAVAANGSWTGNSSTNLQHSNSVAGVLNFSGALIDTSYINSNEPSLFSAHDDADGTIPYQSDFMIIAGFPILNVHGSGLMHQKATADNIDNELISIPSSTAHVSYFGSLAATYEDSVKNASCNFLKNIICPPNSAGINENDFKNEIIVFPNPTNGNFALDLGNLHKNTDITITDIDGKLMFSNSYQKQQKINLSLSEQPAGIYLIKVTSSNKKAVFRLIKE